MRAYFTLFLAFPFLSLFANNTHLLTFQDLLPVGALVLFGVVVTKFVKSDKVLLFVTFAWTMFYVMGLIRIIMLDIPEVWDLADLTAPMYTALISIVGFSMWKKRPTQRALKNGAKFASLLGLMLVVITIAEIEYEDGVAFNESHDIGSIDHVMVDRPNILLIIPDGYSRGDVLMDKFGFDNGPFEDTLRNMGYTIATDSHANYPHTHLSLSSTLNMIYLDELADKLGHGTANHQYAKNMIMDNMAMDILRDNGYTLVQIDSNWEATRTNELYDINLCNVSATTNELILLFSNTSIMSILGGGLNGDMHANRMCFFDSLDDPASWETGPGPYFIMGHIQMPHPPYLFNAQGEALILGTQCENCYINYLQFFNNQIIRAIDGFDGTVIIMSDHGWGADEQGWWDTMTDEDVYNRFATFVATNDASIDPNVSSVNIMRQVFDMPLLEDRAFMSQYQQSYNFKEVTNVINEFEESKMTMGFENFDDYYKDMRDNVAGITPPPVPVPVIEEPVIEEPEPVIPSNTQHATVENAQGSSTPGCEVTNECFIPSSISLKSAPAMVTFVNNDSAAHTSTAGTPADGPSGAWDSSLIMNGSSYSFTLSNDGVYPYFCMVHPWMTGTIVVGDGNEP